MTENEDLIVRSTQNYWLLTEEKIVFLRASNIYIYIYTALHAVQDMPPFTHVKTD